MKVRLVELEGKKLTDLQLVEKVIKPLRRRGFRYIKQQIKE